MTGLTRKRNTGSRHTSVVAKGIGNLCHAISKNTRYDNNKAHTTRPPETPNASADANPEGVIPDARTFLTGRTMRLCSHSSTAWHEHENRIFRNRFACYGSRSD